MLSVTKSFEFAASHFLTNYHGKCENLHGHNYVLHVTVSGPIGSNGLVIDFVHLKQIGRDLVIDKLDHTHLNDLFENPSAENIVVWIWKQLSGPLKGKGVELTELKLWETSTSWVTYCGEGE